MKQTSTKDIIIVKPVSTCQQHVGLINCHGGGEQDKQTHRNRGCLVTETWTNKRFPGRLMILSTRKNDLCSWGVLPPISSLNHVYTCNMVYPALVNSIPQPCMYMQHGVSSTGQQLKTRRTKLQFLGVLPPTIPYSDIYTAEWSIAYHTFCYH